jgi:hypothetical protein
MFDNCSDVSQALLQVSACANRPDQNGDVAAHHACRLERCEAVALDADFNCRWCTCVEKRCSRCDSRARRPVLPLACVPA